MKYALLFRTHYWTPYLQERLDEIKRMSSSADVFIAYDATNSSPPDVAGVAPHSLDSIREIGLYTPRDKALWYCGDYPFYDFYMKNPGYDFYLMIENDVYIKGIDIDGLVKGALDDGADILGAHFQLISDAKPGTAFAKGQDRYETWRKCFFPIVGLKRSALLTFFAERVRQAENKAVDPSYELPFCETYVGSESAKQGMKHKEIGKFVPLRTYGAARYMLYDKVDKEGRDGIWHSVFPADRYIDATIRQEYTRNGKQAFSQPEIVHALRDAMTFADVSFSDLSTKLKNSANDKINKDLFHERMEDFVFPILRSA